MPSRRHHSHGITSRNRSKPFTWRSLFWVLLVVGGVAALVWYYGGKQALPGEISVAEAYQKYDQGAFFLDVREPSEWDSFHIPGATLIPLGDLPARLDEVPNDRQVVVVCRSGNRSQAGRDLLLEAGLTQVTSMVGGVTAWSNAGYPIEGTRP